jgi:hypothetical protein
VCVRKFRRSVARHLRLKPSQDEDRFTWREEDVQVEGFECLLPFCRVVFDSPAELEQHRWYDHPELHDEEEV